MLGWFGLNKDSSGASEGSEEEELDYANTKEYLILPFGLNIIFTPVKDKNNEED